MKPHAINELGNFISGWYCDDADLPVLDSIVDYTNRTNLNPGLTTHGLEPNIKDTLETVLNDNPALYEAYLPILQKSLDQYTKQYPFSADVEYFSDFTCINIQYYKPGAAFHGWHCERSHGRMPSRARHLVFMTYLNTVTDGGQTEFFHQKLKVSPEKGLTLIWPTDWTHIHRGLTSTQEKYIITGWFSFISEYQKNVNTWGEKNAIKAIT